MLSVIHIYTLSCDNKIPHSTVLSPHRPNELPISSYAHESRKYYIQSSLLRVTIFMALPFDITMIRKLIIPSKTY